MRTSHHQNPELSGRWVAARCLIAITILFGSVGPAAAAEQVFVCDIENWNLSPDSGFGAGLGEVRGFATTPLEIPAECLSEGWARVDGVYVSVTRTANGSSTMPVRPEVRFSTIGGLPSDEFLTNGPTADVEDVPIFPAQKSVLLPVALKPFSFDQDDDGFQDGFLASTVFLDGDDTPGQFLPYSRSGPSRHCRTGNPFSPLKEFCNSGDAAFRSMGLGLGISAGGATLGGEGTKCAVNVRTNNPVRSIDNILEMTFGPEADPSCLVLLLDSARLLGPSGETIDSFTSPPFGVPLFSDLTPEEAEFFEKAHLLLEIVQDTDFYRKPLTPAQAIFVDGFESGDISGWGIF